VAREISSLGTALAEEIIRGAIRESIEVKSDLLNQHISTIADLSRLLIDAFRAGGKLVLFGNGGSAADAQHVAAELVNRFQMDRNPLPAIALTTDTSILTSVGNDLAFDELFSRQVRALVQKGDVAVGISTSGNSSNVINGIIAAKEKGAVTVGFTGRSGGRLKDLVDTCCHVSSESTARIQEAQITIWHALCEVIEREMFGV
jgi:D-sedoheptulose 7-phosphate isomerase